MFSRLVMVVGMSGLLLLGQTPSAVPQTAPLVADLQALSQTKALEPQEVATKEEDCKEWVSEMLPPLLAAYLVDAGLDLRISDLAAAAPESLEELKTGQWSLETAIIILNPAEMWEIPGSPAVSAGLLIAVGEVEGLLDEQEMVIASGGEIPPGLQLTGGIIMNIGDQPADLDLDNEPLELVPGGIAQVSCPKACTIKCRDPERACCKMVGNCAVCGCVKADQTCLDGTLGGEECSVSKHDNRPAFAD